MQAVPSAYNLRGAGTLGGAGGENDQENTARLCAEGPYTPSGSVGKSCTETCNRGEKNFCLPGKPDREGKRRRAWAALISVPAAATLPRGGGLWA